MEKTLIILSHPNIAKSVTNKALIEGILDTNYLTIRHLEQIYNSTDPYSIDVLTEQKYLLDAKRVIFEFPLYWYSVPSMLKGYLDVVFTYGFAYGSSGNKLKGKEFKVVVSTGAPKEAFRAGAFNNYTLSELFKPLEQTANLSGMIYTPCFEINATHNITEDTLKQKIIKYKELLDSDWVTHK